ncbi:MAG: hypothetical protein ACRDEA_00810 [Microcystaceae cyanobacterium]
MKAKFEVVIRNESGNIISQLDPYQLALTNQLKESYLSPRLQELAAYYSNRLSYEEVAALMDKESRTHFQVLHGKGRYP